MTTPVERVNFERQVKLAMNLLVEAGKSTASELGELEPSVVKSVMENGDVRLELRWPDKNCSTVCIVKKSTLEINIIA